MIKSIGAHFLIKSPSFLDRSSILESSDKFPMKGIAPRQTPVPVACTSASAVSLATAYLMIKIRFRVGFGMLEWEK
jgi:hypothetical protein